MATCNFRTMRDFDLWVTLEETDNVDDYIWLCREIAGWLGIEKKNSTLAFHEIRLRQGTYRGLQIYVKTLDNYRDFDDEDADYSHGMTRCELIRAYEAEIEEIRALLAEKCPSAGLWKVRSVGVSDSGEEIYEYAR